jgi:adenylate kinase
LAITGTPGTGKSSISRALAARINATVLDIGRMILDEKLTNGFDNRRKTPIADLKLASKRTAEIIDREKDSVIIEGHYAEQIVPRRLVNKIFVLRREPDELKNILEKRGYKEEKVYENVAAEILDVCLWEAINTFGPKKVCEVDVTGRTVEESANIIIAVLEKKKECVNGEIDWLSKIEREGKTDYYLKRF